ncbi:MAG: ACT domain-containing protein [Candidatus Heimdallarchaeota archaeon]
MPKDLIIILEDRPGTLADVGEALGKAGINIDGVCGFPCEGEGIFHILVEDADAARSAIKKTGFEVRGERSVLVLEIEDRPGEFGKITRRIADAGVNIDLAYLATNTRLVIGADDLEKARAAAELR